MVKNFKKVFLFVVFAVVSIFVLACGTEPNKENCKDFCDTCPEINADSCKDYCDTCSEINKDTCKDYCDTCPVINADSCKDFINGETCKPFFPTCNEANKENCEEFCEECEDPNEDNCQEFFPYVAPTAFIIFGDFIPVGKSSEVTVEEFEPIQDNVFKGLIWTSSDESIATVDANGVVTGVKPGDCTITATSMLDPEVYAETEITIEDPLAEDYDIVKREQADIVAQIPAYANASFAFPKPWNTTVEMKVLDASNNEVDGFVYPENLEADTKLTYTIYLTRGATEEKVNVTIWAVKDLEDNPVNRLNSAVAAAEILLKDYTNGVLVSEDIVLPTTIYGTTLDWSSQLPTVLNYEGKYVRQNDDTPVKLDLTLKCGDNSAAKAYNLVAKGYTQEEKLAYILEEGSLAPFNGKDVYTSLALPEFDDKFKAALTYTSSKPEIIDNDGTIVAYPAEATAVEYTVAVDYSFSKNYAFTAEIKFTVNVQPKTAVAEAANAWMTENAYDMEIDFPYGVVDGNVLDVPTTYTYNEVEYKVSWDVSGNDLEAKSGTYGAVEEDGEKVAAFVLTDAGQPKLAVQYLRYTQVQIKGTFTDAEGETAEVVLVINIGASESGDYAYAGSWTPNDQKDSSLNARTGKYDAMVNVSHFDKTVGYISRPTYGWGYWSGIKITAPEYEGTKFQAFIMDYMYWEVVDDGDGVKKDIKTLFNNGGDMGGNWGWLMHNASSHDIMIEVGTYAASGQNYVDKNEDGTDKAVASYGSRISYAMDGYAVGFVADKEGNVLVGSGTGKLQQSLTSDQLVKIGSEEAKYYVGDSNAGTVHYVTVPAGGYAMSWKYQFYSADVTCLYPFCQAGVKLDITKYDRHPLNSQFAVTALEDLESAEEKIAKGGIANNASIEASLNRSRLYFDNELDAITKAEVFDAARLDNAEKAYAAMLDAEIVALLAKEDAELPEGEKPFVTQVGEMQTRLEALSAEITAYLTKKADFDAKFGELAAIDLKVTLDYQGGYAMGYYGKADWNKVVYELFLKDLYDHMVAQGAFQKAVVDDVLVDAPENATPAFAEFATGDYFNNNYAKYQLTILSFYLFTPAYSQDAEGNWVKNENYRDVIEGSDKFFNTEKGNKWIDIMNWVDEATRLGNMSGQDAWGRKDEVSSPSEYHDNVNLVQYSGKDVVISNSGTLLGAYRFAQWVNGKLGDPYKQAIPENTYFATFNRQETQEKYAEIIYHCTDKEVALPTGAYKAGAEFAGWFFEDGTPAVITGALFSDVTVYAKWNPVLEQKIEEVVGTDLTPVYYADDGSGKYTGPKDPGTLADQVNRVGLGKYAVVVGDKLFIMPKYALIELDGTKDYNDVNNLKIYGNGGSDQASTGIIYDAKTDTATGLNSYGHGALYLNTSDAAITLPNVELTYGRSTVSGPNYGYDKIQFVLQEDGSYLAKIIGHTGPATLAKGDFLWCPMTADRYCSGLTNCNGTSGNVGILAEGTALKVIDVSGFLPEDKPWIGVEFYSEGTKLSGTYVEEEKVAVVAPANPSKAGYEFKGWALKADATAEEVVELPAEVTESVVYYAVFAKADKFDAVTVDANLAEELPQTYKTLAEGINHLLDGGTITVKAGTYEEDVVIDRPLTIVGANIETKLAATDAFVADPAVDSVVTGEIAIAEGVKDVVVSGLVMNSQVSLKGNENVTVKNVVFTKIKFDSTLDGAVRVQGASQNVTVDSCYFAAGQANRGIHVNATTTDFTVQNCVVLDEAKASLYDFVRFGQSNFAYAAGTVVMRNNYVTSIQSGIMDRLPAASKYVIEGNTFKSVPAAIYMRSGTVADIEYVCAYNIFDDCGDLAADWDVTAFTTSDTTSVKVNYNAFINCFTKEGDGVDYVIKVRTEAGVIDCANNYFDKEEHKTKNLNATGLTYLESYDAFLQAKYGKLGVSTLDEVYEMLMKDFYAFLKGDNAEFESYETFKAGFDTNWAAGAKYNTYDDKFYAANKQNVIDDTLGTFANSTAYGEKWMGFFNAFDAVVSDVNAAQSMWTSAYTGLMRLRNYFGKGTYRTDARDAMLVAGLNEGVILAKKFDRLAEEMVALFNETGASDAVETTKENFQGTTHPNVKYVFNNADTLAKYKYLFEFALAELNLLKESAEGEGLEGCYDNYKELLTKLIAGDAEAIGGSYAHGRSCLRQFIHRLINANTPENAGNTAYNEYTPDFTQDDVQARFFAAIK